MVGNIIATIANKLTIKRILSEFKKTLKIGFINDSKKIPSQLS